MKGLEQRPEIRKPIPVRISDQEKPGAVIVFTHKRKPSGTKQERRRDQGIGKLPNHIRHDENAAIAVGTWKKRGKEKDKKK